MTGESKNNFYNFDLKQKINSGLCIVFLLVATFWVVLQYSIAKAYDIEHSMSGKNAERYKLMIGE